MYTNTAYLLFNYEIFNTLFCFFTLRYYIVTLYVTMQRSLACLRSLPMLKNTENVNKYLTQNFTFFI